jgi:hypothetical protein
MPSYDERAFTERIEAARKHIRTVLDHTRNPQRPADVPHRYDDKFLLAEFVTRTAVAALVQALEAIGLTAAQAAELRAWAKTRAVTLRLIAHEDCRFLREERRKVESSEYVSEVKGTFGSSTRSEKIITTVVEYRWAFEFEYELVAFPRHRHRPRPRGRRAQGAGRAHDHHPTNRRGPGPSSAHPSTST